MEIKGIKQGLLVILDEQDWLEAKKSLFFKIKEKRDFFQGARLVLDIGNTILGINEIKDIKNELESQGVLLSGILSPCIVTQQAAQSLALLTQESKIINYSELKAKPLDIVLSGESAIMIHRTMRSGFKVAYQGHVIILGDVNPGAEIVASGSIIVWGHLRGTVHAGAQGDETAVICALDLSPMQLRIATKIATTPKESTELQPEIASISDNKIIAELWAQ